MARVLVTGASGQLGQELGIALLNDGFEVIKASHDLLDITNDNQVSQVIEQLDIDAVINASAYTAVDASEDNKVLAYAVNAQGPENLAKACLKKNILLIHVSTDYVFGKNTGKPHSVDEETFCEGVYAQTKLDGEELIKATKCKFLIVRTSWVFGRFGKNFVKAIFNKAKTDGNLKVVLDELGNPTPAHALAQALSRMLKKALSADFNAYGIYHYAGSPALNRFEFAKRIVEISKELNLINSDVNIEPIKKADLNLKAKRPDDSRLDCQKTKEVFDIDMPDWYLYIGKTVC